jgi:hypothetical protein
VTALFSFFDLTRFAAATEHGGLAFLMNLGDLDPPSQLVVPGMTIRRATAVEERELGACTEWFRQSAPYEIGRNPYETDIVTTQINKGSRSFKAVARAAFRYHVVEYTGGTNVLAHRLQEASVLTSTELRIGLEIIINPGIGANFGWGPWFREFLIEASTDDSVFAVLSAADVADLEDAYKKLLVHDHGIVDLASVLRDYRAIKGVPKQSPLRIIAHFAILESLLTHAPKENDPYDSITRQVTQKMALLNRRFGRPIDYTQEFGAGGTKPETIWKKLYGVRSALAHGSRPDFGGPFRILSGIERVDRFIEAATRRVMRQALEEPQLLADLKNC